jgi:hypothetical protein
MVMNEPVKKGVPLLGIIFLALAVFKFINGDGWVVWAILGFLFGGFGIFSRSQSGGNES